MLKTKGRQEGFSALPIIAAILVMVLIIGAGFIILRKNNASDTRKTATPSTTAPNAETPVTPLDLDAQETATTEFSIPEFGVKFTIPRSLSDLTYEIKNVEMTNGRTRQSAYFSTRAIQNADAKCSASFGPIAAVSRNDGQYPKDDDNVALDYGRLLKQFPSSFVAYTPSSASCSTKTEVNEQIGQTRTEFFNAIQSVELTK